MTLIRDLRSEFHRELISNGTLSLVDKGGELIASNADKSQKLSRDIASKVALKIAATTGAEFDYAGKKQAGQVAGSLFEDSCRHFIDGSFHALKHLRPGDWIVRKISSRGANLIGQFEQYSHLAELSRLASEHQELRNFLGDGYTVAPDVAILRRPEPEERINVDVQLVDNQEAKLTALRLINHDPEDVKYLLHASISCKFTMRSDRAQNTRTEALNLIRSRKGRVPHIVAITAEPVPSRIASLAQGTGDIDCVYHFALYELMEAIEEYVQENEIASDYQAQLLSMVQGKRLKDITDLPFDLAI